MHIIAGSAKKRKLEVPNLYFLRPTQERVREAIFSSLEPFLPNACVLDLFAGTGALGLEALSRGAERCVFVEKHPKCIEAIRNNILACNLSDGAVVVAEDVFEYLRRVSQSKCRFDIVLADPPYIKDKSHDFVQEFYSRLCLLIHQCLTLNGLALLGYFTPRAPVNFLPLLVWRQKQFGQTGFVFLRRKIPE